MTDRYRIFTIEQLEKLCAKYQKLLRIQDWRITIKFVHQSELGNDVEGEVSPKLHAMSAIIKIPTAESYQGSETFPNQDMQLTLIHELLHIIFHGLEPSSENAKVYESLWEVGIERTAEAIQSLTMDYLDDVEDVDAEN